MKLIASLFLVSSIYTCGVLSDDSKVISLREYNEQHAGDSRIIGGIPALAGQFPWQVLIIGNISSYVEIMCGGSIVNETKILTAAHCVSYSDVSYRVYMGALTTNGNEPGRISRTSRNYYPHPDYNSSTFENDVGIIELDEPLNFTDNVQPVKLPTAGQSVGTGTSVQISGWGKTSDSSTVSSTILNWTNLTTISNADCQNYYGDVIRSSTLCAIGNTTQSSCSGDSGGAMVVFDGNGTATQVGVTSFVSSAGCGTGRPSGYVRTEAMLDFINAGNGLFISKLLLVAVVLMKVLLR